MLVGLGAAVVVLAIVPVLWWVLRPHEPRGFPLDAPDPPRRAEDEPL